MFRREKYLTRLSTDFLLIISCYYFTRFLLPFYADELFSIRNIGLLGFLLTTWYFTAKFMKLYDLFLSRSLSKELIIVFQMLLLFGLAVISAFFFESHDPENSKPFVISYLAILAVSITVEKYLIRRYYGSKIADKKNTPLMIVGAGEMGMQFFDKFIQNGEYGYKLVGFLDDDYQPNLNGKYLGKTHQLNHLLQHHEEVEDVIVALPSREVDKIKQIVKISEQHAKRVRIIPDFQIYAQNTHVSYIGSVPLISSRKVLLDDPELKFFKRVFDIFFSILLFGFIFIWLFPIIALLIKITSKGPVFFKQQRWGAHKVPFTCYKFRTMKSGSTDINQSGNYEQAVKDDPRTTKVGKLLRKTSIDELPQFFNVLTGSMSIVGPRPHPIPLNIESKEKIDDYMIRHLVKPGITGWAQVNGYRGSTKESNSMETRVRHDIWYIENWSFWLDLQIIIQTVINIFKGEKNAY